MTYLLLLLFIFINIISISLNIYTFDTINELIQKTIIFETDLVSYKIFKYIVPCDNNIPQKNISLQISLDSLDNVFLFIYQSFSDICQDDSSIFLNYKWLHQIFYSSSIIIPNLICNQEYYFVFQRIRADISYYPFYTEVIIVDNSKDIIEISPDLSDHYSIYQRTKNEEKISYSYNIGKFGLINFNNIAQLRIIENDVIIYDNESVSFSEIIEFKENTKYIIIYNTNYLNSPINLQFFDESPIIKYNYKNGPPQMTLYNFKYYIEMDISNFAVGDNILLYFYAKHNTYNFLYQFKSIYKGSNFIDLGEYYSLNYIPIKKTKEESSLIISIQFSDYRLFSLLNIILYKIEEITSEKTLSINGPIYFILDYYTLNNMNSIGIESNEKYLLFEKEIGHQTKIAKKEYINVYFTKYNNLEPHIFKKAIIFYNSTNEALFEIKKFPFSIFSPKLDKYEPENEFFQLCQGENTQNELYFYMFKDSSVKNINYLFTSVFGDFNSYFILENEISNISGLDFDIIDNINFYHFDANNGYLKINCSNPTMIKHSKISYNYETEFNSGQKYYIKDDNIKNSRKYGFDKNLVNKTFSIKFNVFGLRPNQSVNINFDNMIYEINESPLEINDYYYKDYSSEIFYFECVGVIDNLLMAEIIVGFLNEDLEEKFQVIDFTNSFGTLSINSSEGLIIRIPKNFNEDLYDFSILLLNTTNNDIHISYDDLKYQVPKNKILYPNSPIIPLFKTNPYDYIEEKGENAFFYILIYNLNYNARDIIIKKPKLYSDIKLNEINILPQTAEDEVKYYYQIEVPEFDSAFLLVQAIKTFSTLKMTISKNSIHYPLTNNYEEFIHHFNIPIEDTEKSVYLNYFETDSFPGYINLVGGNQINYPSLHLSDGLNPNIEQIEGKNRLKIKMDSLSYIHYQNKYKYYLLFNINETNLNLYSILTGKINVNSSDFQIMKIIEDDGSKKILEFEFDINIDLKEDNYYKINNNNILFVPVNIDKNLLELFFITKKDFKYINHNKNKKITLVLVIVSFVVIVFVTLVLMFYFNIGKELIQKYKDKKLLKEDVEVVVTTEKTKHSKKKK